MKLPDNTPPDPTCSVCKNKLLMQWGKWFCPFAMTHENYKVVQKPSEYQKVMWKKLNLKDEDNNI